MNPFVRELKRLSRKPVLVVSFVALALLGPVLGTVLQYPPVPPGAPLLATSVTRTTGYEVVVLLFDSSGHPIAGASVTVVVSPANSTAPTVYDRMQPSGPDGVARFLVNVSSGNYSIEYDADASGVQLSLLDALPPLAPGQVALGGDWFGVLTYGSFVDSPTFFVAAVAADGSAVTGLSVWYNVSVPSQASPSPGSRSFVQVATLDHCPQMVALPVPNSVPSFAAVSVEIRNGTGGIVGSNQYFAIQLEERGTGPNRAGHALIEAIGELWIVAAALGVGIGYAGYARDRVTRGLEPLLVLPTTRAGILRDRFIAGVAALGIGIVIATVSLLLSFDASFDVTIAPSFSVAVLGAAFAIGLSFLGLSILVSHLVRSVGAALTGAIGLVTVFAVLWPALVLVVAEAIGVSPATYGSVDWQAEVFLLNPVGAGQGALAFFQTGIVPPGANDFFAVVSNSGLVAFSLAMWVLAPPIVAFILARRQD